MNETPRSLYRVGATLRKIGIFATATATFSLSSVSLPPEAGAVLPSSLSVTTTLNQPIAALPNWCRYIPRRYRKYVADCL